MMNNDFTNLSLFRKFPNKEGIERTNIAIRPVVINGDN